MPRWVRIDQEFPGRWYLTLAQDATSILKPGLCLKSSKNIIRWCLGTHCDASWNLWWVLKSMNTGRWSIFSCRAALWLLQVLSKCQVLKHFFLIKMWQVRGVTTSEANKYRGITVLQKFRTKLDPVTGNKWWSYVWIWVYWFRAGVVFARQRVCYHLSWKNCCSSCMKSHVCPSKEPDWMGSRDHLPW